MKTKLRLIMNKILWQRTFTIGAMAWLGCLSVPAQTTNLQLYGITFFGNQVITIDTATGQGSLLGPLNASVSAYGIATRSNALYTFDPNNNRILPINRTTGTTRGALNIGVTNLQGEGDLAFRSDGIGFLSSALNADASVANDLYTFNVITGTSHRVGTTSISIDALAFDQNDVLYALGQDDSNLYIVNQTDGTVTTVGSLGVALMSPFAGMTFGPDGTLYAAINDRLYTINKTTGAASAVSTNVLDFGFSSVSGLAFGPLPSPAAFFAGEVSLGENIYYLTGTNQNVFGYYSLLSFPYVYHFDLGFEYFIDAGNVNGGAYFYDFASSTFFYTEPNLFPYLYDFTLNAWLYYYPDAGRPGRYTSNPRYFYNFGTHQVINK